MLFSIFNFNIIFFCYDKIIFSTQIKRIFRSDVDFWANFLCLISTVEYVSDKVIFDSRNVYDIGFKRARIGKTVSNIVICS
jgi:hypothetical protein